MPHNAVTTVCDHGRVVGVRGLEPGVPGSIPSRSGHGEVPFGKAYLVSILVPVCLPRQHE